MNTETISTPDSMVVIVTLTRAELIASPRLPVPGEIEQAIAAAITSCFGYAVDLDLDVIDSTADEVPSPGPRMLPPSAQ